MSLRCHDPDACAFGQHPCPTPAVCGCAPEITTMTTPTLAQRIDHFDAYFRSANNVPPNARISVPTAEWQELRAALANLATSPTQCLNQIAEPAAAPQAAQAAVPVDVERARLIAKAASRFADDTTHLGSLVYVNDLVWALSVLAAHPAEGAPAMPWRAINDGMPEWTDDSSIRVIAVTAGDDFGGVQLHDVPASDFYYHDHHDPAVFGTEVTEACTHWAYRDEIWPRAALAATLAPALDLESLVMPKNPHSAAAEPAQHIAWAQGAGAVFATVEAALAATTAAPAADAPPPPQLLAKQHQGMKVDYRGLLGQVRRAIKSKAGGHAEMLRQLEDHLTQLGQRWYAGDVTVVDELLQLYCIERDTRAAIAARAAQGGA